MSLFGIMWQNEMLQMNRYDARTVKTMYESDVSRRLNKAGPAAGYHRYLVSGADGKEETCLIYMAPYRRYAQSDTAWRLEKAVYIVLFLAAIVCTCWSLSLQGALTRAVWVELAGVLTMLSQLYLLYTMVFHLAAPRRMTIYQHAKGVRRFRAALVVSAVLSLAYLAATAVWVWGVSPALQGADTARAALIAGAAVAAVLMALLELMRKCPQVPNDSPLPEGAREI